MKPLSTRATISFRLYLDPPSNALVLAVDEKPSILLRLRSG
jgi:hypothetical protein